MLNAGMYHVYVCAMCTQYVQVQPLPRKHDILKQCCFNVCDAGPTLNQHCFNVSGVPGVLIAVIYV